MVRTWNGKHLAPILGQGWKKPCGEPLPAGWRWNTCSYWNCYSLMVWRNFIALSSGRRFTLILYDFDPVVKTESPRGTEFYSPVTVSILHRECALVLPLSSGLVSGWTPTPGLFPGNPWQISRNLPWLLGLLLLPTPPSAFRNSTPPCSRGQLLARRTPWVHTTPLLSCAPPRSACTVQISWEAACSRQSMGLKYGFYKWCDIWHITSKSYNILESQFPHLETGDYHHHHRGSTCKVQFLTQSGRCINGRYYLLSP